MSPLVPRLPLFVSQWRGRGGCASVSEIISESVYQFDSSEIAGTATGTKLGFFNECCFDDFSLSSPLPFSSFQQKFGKYPNSSPSIFQSYLSFPEKGSISVKFLIFFPREREREREARSRSPSKSCIFMGICKKFVKI